MAKIRQQIMFKEAVYGELCGLRDKTNSKNLSITVNWYFTYAANEINKLNAQIIKQEYEIERLKGLQTKLRVKNEIKPE